MTEHGLWRFARALHRAINERQFDDIESQLDEDVQWAVYGPIDLFAFFGSRRGKADALEVVRQIAEKVRIRRFERESVILGVDSAASLTRYSLTLVDTSKPVALRTANFTQFKNGLVTNYRVMVDSLDLVEQTVGYPIQLSRIAGAR